MDKAQLLGFALVGALVFGLMKVGDLLNHSPWVTATDGARYELRLSDDEREVKAQFTADESDKQALWGVVRELKAKVEGEEACRAARK